MGPGTYATVFLLGIVACEEMPRRAIEKTEGANFIVYADRRIPGILFAYTDSSGDGSIDTYTSLNETNGTGLRVDIVDKISRQCFQASAKWREHRGKACHYSQISKRSRPTMASSRQNKLFYTFSLNYQEVLNMAGGISFCLTLETDIRKVFQK